MILIPTHIRVSYNSASFIARRIGGRVVSEGNLDDLIGKEVIAQSVTRSGLPKNFSRGKLASIKTQLQSIGAKRCSVPSVSIDNGEEGWTHRVDTFHIGRNRYLVIFPMSEKPDDEKPLYPF